MTRHPRQLMSTMCVFGGSHRRMVHLPRELNCFPESTMVCVEQAERTGLSRALERSDGVGGIDWGRWRMSPSPRASDPRAWHAYPPPSPPSPPSLRQSRFPRPRPGNTLSIGPSSRHPGTGASWHHLWFQEVLRPQVQGTGTLSSSPVQGMGSGTLAVAATGGRRILPSRGVGTLAVW